MAIEFDVSKLIVLVEDILKNVSDKKELSSPIAINSRMGDPIEWDSLTFVSIFIGVGEAYEIELDDDDAIHFQSIDGIATFLSEIME